MADDQLLPPDQRVIMRRLAEGGELWLHEYGGVAEARLYVGERIYRLSREDLHALLARGLIRPLEGVETTRYQLTNAGRDKAADS